MRSTALALLTMLLMSPAIGRAAPPAAGSGLRFFKNYFVTGDYVVGGIGLRGTGVGGVATGTIDMTNADIPDGVDILAAFLYWETVDLVRQSGGANGARFRGNDISTLAFPLNPAGSAPCWSSGGATGSPSGAHKMLAYRADVLRFLPLGADLKHLVKTEHAVQLPDAGSGNAVPSSAGASLVIVYRDPRMPLKAVVLYDGGFTMDQSSNAMVQGLSGFYQAAAGPARVTHIVGDGQSNFSERLLFNNTVIAINPFVGAQGPASDPAWDNPTFTISNAPPLGDAASTTVDHVGITPFDCLSWGAVVFSTPVQDTDADGLLDIWESSTTTLYDPNGQALPNLKAMGADPNMKDIFIEVGYLTAAGASSNPVQGTVPPHDHLPSRSALDMLGQAFANAPISYPGSKKTGIQVHFDVGGAYQTPPAPHIIPASLARGGESIPEAGCSSDVNPPCQFQEFPGTIGWKSGYRFYRDQPLNYPSEQACVAAGAACERRFDRNRKDIFHYALFAHAVGLPRSTDPASPLNHVPANTSGIADLVGGDMLVTLGFWDNLNGSDYMQAATLMHELGHNFGLRHGGRPFEFNCKPNYQSVMNYLFQARGLQNGSGVPVLDYSRQALPALDPNRASEPAPFGSPITLPYYTRWYAPIASSFLDMALHTTPATKHCNGSPLSEAVGWVRVDGTTLQAPFDWNANGTLDIAAYSQDLSFNGVRLNGDLPLLNAGVNDWALVDLRQVGGRRNVGSRRINGSMSLDVGFADVGFGDVGFGDVGFGDVGFGDVGFGDVGYGDVGFGDVGFGDVGFGDVGFGDVGFGDVGAPAGDLDLDTAVSLGNAPNALTAAVARRTVNLSWQKPHVGDVNDYIVYRVTGAGITRSTISTLVTIASPQSPTTTAVDTATKNNTTYTYFIAARFFDGTQSGISNAVTLIVK